MAFDYFTLRALACELEERLAGAVIARAASGEEELVFSTGEWLFQAFPGRGGCIGLSQGPFPEALPEREGAERYLVRARILEASADADERILRLHLERRDARGETSRGQLLCELVPPFCRLVLLSERTGAVLGLWGDGRRSLRVGRPYALPPPSARLLPGRDAPGALAAALEGGEADGEKILSRLLAGVDRTTARELVHRYSPEAGIGPLWEGLADLYTLPASAAAFTWEEGGRPLFSALEPTRLGEGAYARVERVSQAVFQTRHMEGARRQQERRGQKLGALLRQALRRAERRLEALRADLAQSEAAAELERKGSALMAHLEQVPSGAAQVELPDVYDIEGVSRLHIELERGRSPAENAARYLKRAEKYRRRRQVLPARLAQVQERKEALEAALAALERGEAGAAGRVETLLEELGEVKKVQNRKVGQTPEAHPRRYRTAEGWSVWAGRNNRENDVLTHRLAAQNDLWFHAHGYAGAHVVLRREGRKEEPSARSIEEAAAVAAYWSKGKTASKVPVVYTLAKYVSRARGAPPGQAQIRREKTLMVRPALLPEEGE